MGGIEELGIEVSSFPKYLERDLYGAMGRVPKIFFDKETFGTDKLVDDPCPFPGGETFDLAVAGPDAWTHFLAGVPRLRNKAGKTCPACAGRKKIIFPNSTRNRRKTASPASAMRSF